MIVRTDWSEFETAIRSTVAAGTLTELGFDTVCVIVNPFAGAFSSPKRVRRTLGELQACRRAHHNGAAAGVDSSGPAVRFHYTHYVGHAMELALEEAEEHGSRLLLVSAGGDGTHGEVMRAALSIGQERAAVVRMPLGTGNDGADAPDLESAVAILTGKAIEQRAGHLRIEPTNLRTHYGFNIASIGLDAYIASVTNRLKRHFRGDLYKVVADVATLFYQQLVGVAPMTLSIASGETTEVLEGEYMLTAIGVSGNRMYGGGKRVLPGKENLCAIEPLGLLGKIKLKALFYEGAHVHEPTVTMREATDVRVEYSRRVPMQVDGESLWLSPDHFPVRFTVLPPSVPVLAPAPDGGLDGSDQSKS